MNQANQPASQPADQARRVIPRAEFRVFGHGFADDVKARLWNGRTILQAARTMPLEWYVVSRHTDSANVKLRDALLDVKLKIGETSDGFEIFQPSGKYQFPVTRDRVVAILGFLEAESGLDQETYTADDFLTLARRHQDLAVVGVDKERWGFLLDGVIGEVAHVRFNGALLESACLESDQHDVLRAVVAELGLAERPNTNYLRAAKRVIGMV